MDLSKLTAAPWQISEDHEHGGPFVAGTDGYPILIPESDGPDGRAALEIAALARNAFDVMMRRGWTAETLIAGKLATIAWIAVNDLGRPVGDDKTWPDPFTALVEADQWYSKNVEGK